MSASSVSSQPRRESDARAGASESLDAALNALRTYGEAAERRTTEERLRKSEMLLRIGQEIGRIGSFSRDLSTNEIDCSPQAREIFHLPAGDAPVPTGLWLATILEEDRGRVAAEMAAAVQRRDANILVECRTRAAPDAPLKFIEIRARYLFDESGRPTGSVGVVIDLTERRQIEERLRSSETFLRMAMSVGRIGPFRHDLTGSQLIECEAETKALHGLAGEAGPVLESVWHSTILAEDRPMMHHNWRHALEQRLPELDFSYRVRRVGDGAVRHIEARTKLEYDSDGRPLTSTGVVIDVTERKEAERLLAHAASHDALTNLPNRILFEDRIGEALARARRGERFALFCLDLDRFKEVNDTLGHPVGDRLLKAVAQRLGPVLREVDTLARLGGDEFAIIQAGLEHAHEAAALARRLTERLTDPFEIDGNLMTVGVSIGIAIAPEDGVQYHDLLKAADMALYQAKARNRGGWRFFESEMNELMQARRALEIDLRAALERNEFELFYQPIIDVGSRKVKSLEALIRWRHPVKGIVPPNEFIPFCEETGLIVPLGAWVIRKACQEALQWADTLSVAVNLSPAQFGNRNLCDIVGVALADSGFPARRLELEITESVMLHDAEGALSTLHALKRLGVRIAMDDFGTGYSSLSYLQSFPFDKVKIDRAFTQGLAHSHKSDAIVKAVTDLCEGLGMTTTAEGVETEEQFAALANRGCGEAQGFLFSPPRAAGEIPALLDRLGVIEEHSDEAMHSFA